MDELTEIADRLYAGSADGFTEARNAAAREVDDKALAAQVKKLKKPSVAAWSINLLVRRESGQIDSVLDLADSLRAAARPSTATSCGRSPGSGASSPRRWRPRLARSLARPASG